MANIQGRRGKLLSPRGRAWIAISVLIILTFIFGRATLGIYKKNALAEENREAAERELQELIARKRSAEEKLANLSSEAGVEEEIRRGLPVAKEGERVIVIIDKTATGTDTETESRAEKKGFWATIFGVISN